MFDKVWAEAWRQGPLAGLLALALFGNFSQIWVWGSVYKAEQDKHAECQKHHDLQQWKASQFREVAYEAIGRTEDQARWRKRQAEAGRTQSAKRVLGSIKETEEVTARARERMKAAESATTLP